MFFGMMEAQRGYNTGQTEDYLKYKWIGLEVKGFQLVLDFGFGFLFGNERPASHQRLDLSRGG